MRGNRISAIESGMHAHEAIISERSKSEHIEVFMVIPWKDGDCRQTPSLVERVQA